MMIDKKLLDLLEISFCFLCKMKFKKGDVVAEFFGGYAHFECFDDKMKENKRNEERNNE